MILPRLRVQKNIYLLRRAREDKNLQISHPMSSRVKGHTLQPALWRRPDNHVSRELFRLFFCLQKTFEHLLGTRLVLYRLIRYKMYQGEIQKMLVVCSFDAIKQQRINTHFKKFQRAFNYEQFVATNNIFAILVFTVKINNNNNNTTSKTRSSVNISRFETLLWHNYSQNRILSNSIEI